MGASRILSLQHLARADGSCYQTQSSLENSAPMAAKIGQATCFYVSCNRPILLGNCYYSRALSIVEKPNVAMPGSAFLRIDSIG